MCGRYGRRADKQRIAEWMPTYDMSVFNDSHIEPSFNATSQSNGLPSRIPGLSSKLIRVEKRPKRSFVLAIRLQIETSNVAEATRRKQLRLYELCGYPGI